MFVERDTETLIDTQLGNLGWIDSPRNPERNVWKQTAKTDKQRLILGRMRPDYVLYESRTDRAIAVIEAKRPNKDINNALVQGSEYARALEAPIVFATDGIYTKSLHIPTSKSLFRDGEEIDEFIREPLAIQYV